MMSRILQFFKLYRTAGLWGLFSGVLVGTSWIPFSPWALFFCYVPLWYFTLKKANSPKEILFAGWVAQFVLTLIGFHWLIYTAHEYGYMPWAFSFFILLVFAAGMHIYVPLALLGAVALGKKFSLSKGAMLLLFAGLMSLLEQNWPSIFAWNLGYPLIWVQSPLAQWADVVGFAGLSFGIYLINALVTWLLLRRERLLTLGSLLVMGGLLALLVWGGQQKKLKWSKTDSELKVLLVQANIGNAEKIFAEQGRGYQQSIINQFFELTQQGLRAHPEAQLIVWPESAFPDILDDFAMGRNYPAQFRYFVQSIKKPILTGAYSKDPPGKPFRDDYNSVFLMDENGRLLSEPYHKTQLLIFGEYIPFGREFPLLAKLNPGGIGWGRGQGPMVMPFGEDKIGVQICYESLDPHFSAELAKKGATLLVNVTNDSWFGPSFEPQQHLFMTLARAVETRRPLIRSTNTGVSSVILADGTVLERSPLFEKWQGQYDVKFQKNPELSFHSRFGSW
ncbi:MAG: apolipoprotein N-acyltransferase, partial [Pseudobdellovibrionaceae bacterium]